MSAQAGDAADEFLLREYSRRLSVDAATFFRNIDDVLGIWDLIERRLAKQAYSHARKKGIPFADLTDSTGYILDKLAHDTALAGKISCADETAIGYANTAISRWLNSDTSRTFQEAYLTDGVRRTRTEWVDHISIDTPGLVFETHSPDIETEMTLSESIDRTATLLEQGSTSRLREHVYPAVEWLTNNWPSRRSYGHHTLADAYNAFPQLLNAEVKAVAAATWGARNREHETSFVRGFLSVPDFNPATHATFRKALNDYRYAVHRSVLSSH